MDVIKILYKIVENPVDQKNYTDLKACFDQKDPHVAEAILHLLEVKYGPDYGHNPIKE